MRCEMRVVVENNEKQDQKSWAVYIVNEPGLFGRCETNTHNWIPVVAVQAMKHEKFRLTYVRSAVIAAQD